MSYNSDFHSFAERLRGFMEASTAIPRRANMPMGSKETDRQFTQMALELFGLQFAHNLAYRKICEVQQITPSSITDWCQIPAVPTAAFKEFDLSCLPPQERTALFLSSGTTETRPSRHFHNRQSLLLYEQSVLSWFRCAGGDEWLLEDNPIQSFLSLTPDKTAAPHSSLAHMFECVGSSGHFDGSEFFGAVGADGSWTLDVVRLRDRLAQAAGQCEPIMMVGTAFSFVHLLDYLSEETITFVLPSGSRVLETGGYKGRSRSLPKSELHTLITALLGVPAQNIIREYGMAELSSQAYDLLVSSSQAESDGATRQESLSRQFYFPPWARVHIASPENGAEVSEGQAGLIRVFDLANVYSVMAIQTEDLAVRCGSGFELIGRTREAEPRGCSLMAVAG